MPGVRPVIETGFCAAVTVTFVHDAGVPLETEAYRTETDQRGMDGCGSTAVQSSAFPIRCRASLAALSEDSAGIFVRHALGQCASPFFVASKRRFGVSGP